MLKKLFFLLVGLFVVAAVVIFFFGSTYIGKGIKKGVEEIGPRLTQTPVTLENVNLSLLSGDAILTGLNIGNPEGYTSENIFALGEIDVDIDTQSIFSDTIIINHIHIRKPEISYERTLRNSNLKDLMKNVEEFTGPKTETTSPTEDPETEAPAGAKKKFIIRDLTIEDGSVYVGLMGAGSKIPLPKIQMTDLGEGDAKQSIAQILDQVLQEVMKSIGPAISQSGVDSMIKDGLKNVSESGGEQLKQATDGIKKLFGN